MKTEKDLNVIRKTWRKLLFSMKGKAEYISIPLPDKTGEWTPFGVIDNDEIQLIDPSGEDMTMMMYKNTSSERKEFPPHKHKQREMGFVVVGSCSYETEYERINLSQGDSWDIPKDEPHAFYIDPGTIFFIGFIPKMEVNWSADFQ